MSENEAKSLAGERARIQLTPADTGFVVTFGPDVKLEWVNGGRLGQQEDPTRNPKSQEIWKRKKIIAPFRMRS